MGATAGTDKLPAAAPAEAAAAAEAGIKLLRVRSSDTRSRICPLNGGGPAETTSFTSALRPAVSSSRAVAAAATVRVGAGKGRNEGAGAAMCCAGGARGSLAVSAVGAVAASFANG